MSKAFKRDDDNPTDGEDEVDDDPAKQLGVGIKNYITPAGAKRLRDELDHLLHTERPEVVRVVAWAAGNGDRSENADYIYGKRRLREIDRRMRFISRRLDIAEEVDPLEQAKLKPDKVLFGATVIVADENGNKKTYSIVGIDEVDIAKGYVSWNSPIGKALLQAREGDVVSFNAPGGMKELEIVSIDYKSL